jgi:hypothetical protein
LASFGAALESYRRFDLNFAELAGGWVGYKDDRFAL